jgi:hypothetical protein
MTSTDQQAALEKAAVAHAYFAYFDFKSAAVRVSNFNQTVEWGGYEWLGMGTLGSISQITETDSLESSPVNFNLNVADPSLVALAIGPVEEYRGRVAKLWMCPLDENYALIDTPILCWRGRMDMMSLGVGQDSGNITLKCETAAFGLKRQPSLRMNAAQQKKRHPTDTGFDFLTGLIANPAVWLSRRFQQI